MSPSLNLQQRAYAHIYRKLANDELLPGARLSNRALAKEIGVSVIPVREAISQLASKGLLEHQPGLGTFVPQPKAEEYFQLLDLREALECHAVAKVCGRLTATDFATLEKHNQVLTDILNELRLTRETVRSVQQLERWQVADAAFHMTLLRAAANQRLLDFVRDLRIMSQLFSRLGEPQPLERLTQTRDEHDCILAALRRGDRSEAREMMARHIQRRWSFMARLFEKTAQDAASPTEGISPAVFAAAVQERLREVEL